VYPDGKTARYSYDKQGQPVEVAFANCRFAYDWDNRRSLRRVVFECENEVQELRLDKDRLDINLVPNGEDSAGQFDFVSALGLWACSAEGALSEMILPDGERLFTRSPSVTGGVAFWDSSGEMTCHSDKQGVLSNVLFPNGLRAAWRRSSEKGRVYLVGPGGVALNQYSREGKLLKTRWAEGQYTVFSYDRRGEVKKVATSCGWVKLRHDAAGRLQRAHFSSGLSAELSHGTATYPTAISLRNTAMDSLSAALVSMRTIWEWTVARPSLRLEDSALREV
jgi:YD repeat-containing protein